MGTFWAHTGHYRVYSVKLLVPPQVVLGDQSMPLIFIAFHWAYLFMVHITRYSQSTGGVNCLLFTNQ